MSKLRTKATPVLLGVVLWATAIFPFTVPSVAAETQISISVNAVGQLRLLSQMLASDVALLHLGIEGKAPHARAKGYLTKFSQLHNGLLYGDPKQNLVAPKSEKVKGHLKKINAAWILFAAAINVALDAKTVTSHHLESISGLSEALYDATTETRKAYHASMSKRLHSQLDIAIEAAVGQVALTQKIIKEYLFIASKHKPLPNKSLLAASYKLFDRTLKGLIHGDAGQKLLSVPDPKVQAQLATVEKVWVKCLPLLKRAAADKHPNRTAVVKTMNLNRQLMSDMSAAAVLYRKL